MLDGFTTMFLRHGGQQYLFYPAEPGQRTIDGASHPEELAARNDHRLVLHRVSLRLLLYGISVLGASNASILNILEPLTSLISGALIYGDQLSIPTMIGCGLVILAILLVSLAGKISQNKTKQRKNSL